MHPLAHTVTDTHAHRYNLILRRNTSHGGLHTQKGAHVSKERAKKSRRETLYVRNTKRGERKPVFPNAPQTNAVVREEKSHTKWDAIEGLEKQDHNAQHIYPTDFQLGTLSCPIPNVPFMEDEKQHVSYASVSRNGRYTSN